MDAEFEDLNEVPASSPGFTSRERPIIERLKRRFLYGLIFGVAVIALVAIAGNGPALAGTLGRFDWRLLPIIVGLTLANYVLRFAKWQFYLRWLKVGAIPTRTSLGIFFAGFSMAVTPGKVGEFLKAYLLRRATGVPVATTAPIVLVERLTDGMAMLVLAAAGLATARYGWQFLVVMALGAAAGVFVLQRRALVLGILTRLEHLPLLSSRAHLLRAFYESTYLLLRPGNLLIATGIGVISWSGECLAFALILTGLGLPFSWSLLATATFILAIATMAGAISMLPGGLGAAEASIAGLLLLLVHDPRMTTELAAAATLLVRFATLWFGVLLGIAGLFAVERHLRRATERPVGAGLASNSD
ncbi:lysylphosphatidylglycerol synthase transmembrane domain-containing protein [Nitrolancea hollandica]|uniref:Integral membrane protein n=1 Tax=Nitrolancea hollandica Lb TaxID=1129897 RepID=I4EEM4_9BACT|nr:lysylphosphatidylglycerol synthase transmembrane domain-containing protein [Nitrolancea hollandica]CCF83136.1 conserved membrane hypothetical protein [Nitrolancea hollandica Lb]